ncbi:unnamed protein product [Durusdinium trenchii]|uniref:AAA+ ATPase domain-containing protein n=1 Tax=Durusdinium trenchii TaxID=1381693 RepID=A0ABP0IIC6_9DINO
MEIGRRKMDTYAVRLGFRAYFQHLHGIYSVFASVCVCVRSPRHTPLSNFLLLRHSGHALVAGCCSPSRSMTNLRPEAVVVLPSLWLLASVFQNLWIPLVVLAAAFLLYVLGKLLEGLQFNFQLFGANTTSSLTMTIDAAELEVLKVEFRELKEQLFGEVEISEGRLGKSLAMLRNLSRLDAKVQEMRDVLRMLEHDQSSTLEEIFLRQQQKGRELARFAVDLLTETLTAQDFWKQLGPHLLAAGVVQHLDPETMLRLETEKARAQEQLRIDRGIPQSIEHIRVGGWIRLYEAMAKDFDQSLPYRASVFLAVCTALVGLGLFYQIMKRRMRIPRLVDETSVSWRFRRKGDASVREVFDGDRQSMDRPKVVLSEEVRQTVEDMALVASKRRHRSHSLPLPLPNAVFFGPPGTGKSLTARRLAESCGMDYAILSGGNILGLKEEAVPELRRVFRWARRSSRGLLLFIDEAEAFLCCRSSQSNSYVQAAVSFFLAQTGASSSQLQLILATNRIQDLDGAVLSRLVLRIEFGWPDAQLLQQQVDDRLLRLEPKAAERFQKLVMERAEQGAAGGPCTLGEALHGWAFSGRDVQGLVEEFARRWSLEEELGRKADKEWLDRWFLHRGVASS